MIEVALNPAQREAVEYEGGPLLVLAGAGSGKTRVLTARVAHLMEVHDVAPSRIFVVTFTNRAAGEMRDRVAELLGRDPAGLWIGTFHSLAARLLRREALRIGFTSQFSIYDEGDRLSLIKRLLNQRGYGPRVFPPRHIQSIISAAKNRLLSPDELEANAGDRIGFVAAEIYRDLAAALSAANAMDFDDLLLNPLKLFNEHADRLEFYRQRFDAILVDEFQDTNRAQYLLVRHLGEKHHNVSVVGDDDQSIYSWRGADVRNMLDFEHDFPDARVIRLEENYRSTQIILDAANGVIAENQERLGKTLFTSRKGGDLVTIATAADERDEAEWIARELRARSAEDYPYRSMAILYRTNAQSRALEEAMRRTGVPYRVVGAAGFYERREIKDLIAYLRLAVNPADDEAFLRAVQVPKRGIGLASLTTLHAAARQWSKALLATAAIADRISDLRPLAKGRIQGFADLIDGFRQRSKELPPAPLLEHIVEAIDYESHVTQEGPQGMDRMENVRELIAGAAEWEEESEPEDPSSVVEQFLTSAALTSVADEVGGDPEGVTLMTLHTAKGLEWPIVFLSGMEDGLFPLSRSLDSPKALEEERRLAYVGITRAQHRIYVTWARMRRRAGQQMPGIASRFIDGIPPGIVEECRTSGVFGGDLYRRQPGAISFHTIDESEPELVSQDLPRFIKGERVRHKQFGSGTIAGLTGQGKYLKATVQFDDDDVGVKQLLVAYAGLERDWDSA